jgi:hypothetical protein
MWLFLSQVRQQAQGGLEVQSKYTGVVRTLTTIYKNEGKDSID